MSTTQVTSLTNSFWNECKIIGKNISQRTNSRMVSTKSKLYLYGGYNCGVLDDFYILDLQKEYYEWKEIKQTTYQTSVYPGKRYKHHLASYKDDLYLFAGIQDGIENNRDMYQFRIKDNQWFKINQNKSYPPCIDNSAYCQNPEIWYFFGGYYGEEKACHSNDLYAYQFHSNQFINLVQVSNQPNQNKPSKREGSAITICNQNLYMFGGNNGGDNYNDLWMFNLDQKFWTEINQGNTIPLTRKGHSLISYENKLILFGGFHDITYELDDLMYFNLDQLKWVEINCVSNRIVKNIQKEHKVIKLDNSSLIKTQLFKKNFILLNKSKAASKINHKKNNQIENRSYSVNLQNTFFSKQLQLQSPSPSRQESKSINRNEITSRGQTRSQSNHFNVVNGLSSTDIAFKKETNRLELNSQTRESKKRQVKLKLLRDFNLDMQEYPYALSPTTQQMKNSLLRIGNPKPDLKIKSGRIPDLVTGTFSKFLQPLKLGEILINGKRPSARDGHCTSLINNNLYIFGGDRHQICFNDLHFLELSKLE